MEGPEGRAGEGSIDDPGLTRTGEILGTPSYLAPEVLGGGKGGVTAAADVYCLGAMLYEVLAGITPFPGASHLDVIDRIRREEPKRPRTLNPRVPRDLETVCLKCLEKDPGKRYPSAAALADDLARFLGGLPVAARPIHAAARLWRWCRRNPARAVALLAVLAVATDDDRVHVWDLTAIRRALAEIGLDW